MTKTINAEDTRRKATWYDCGTDISKATSIKEALQISGLDYEVADYMDIFKAKAEGLAAQKVSDTQFTSLLEVLFPINEDLDTTRKQNSMQAARQALTAAYKEDDLQNFQGTKWGIINAYSDFITHKEPGRKTDSAVQSRFMEVTLNPHIMKHFVDMLDAIA